MVVNDVLVNCLVVGGTLKAFFFFWGAIQLPDDEFNEFLDNDGLEGVPINDPNYKELKCELELVKNEFKKYLLTEYKGQPIVTNQTIKAITIRIRKIRMIIQFRTYISFNRDHRGDKYLVARTYWLDHNGKQVKKFAKVLGKEENIKKKGKISSNILDQVESDLRQIMWDQYKKEYYLTK
jgi:hypothetical protein